MFRKKFLAPLNRHKIRPISATLPDLETWFESPLGQQLLNEEKKTLDQVLNCMFGYHLMQLSVSAKSCLYEGSRVSHCFSMKASTNTENAKAAAFAEYDNLPLEDESIDVTILHHVLEFSSNPHQVLKEASRVTIPRGYIIILGFNPFSSMGLIKPFAQAVSSKAIWQRHSLRRSRISDWLQFLDCNTIGSESAHFNLPVQNNKLLAYGDRMNGWLRRSGLPFGNVYCLIARKDRASIRPIRPSWSKYTGFRSAKPAISARSAARLALVKNNKQQGQ